MPTYICQGRYSREAIQGMIKSPEDRTQVVAKLMKGVGGIREHRLSVSPPGSFHASRSAGSGTSGYDEGCSSGRLRALAGLSLPRLIDSAKVN